jgi:Arylsulfotransferase (ASST)
VAPERRWTRRGLLTAAGAVVVGAAGRRASARPLLRLLARVESGPPYVSRPDLRPPQVTVTTPASGTATGLIFVAPFEFGGSVGPHYGPLIVDDTGELVWFEPRAKLTAMNLKVQRYHGAPVLTWYEGNVVSGYGGSYVIADPSYSELARVHGGEGLRGDLHEFVITSRNTALIAIYSQSIVDLTAIGGQPDAKLIQGIVQEIDIATGRVLFEWRSYDHVPVAESYMTGVTSDGTVDYFHLNSIGVDLDGNLLISARHTSTVYKVNRKSGAIIWRLGGKKSDFTFGPNAAFSFQHDARRHPDGTLTLFDNAAADPTPAGAPPVHSRPLRLALDLTTRTVALVADYEPTTPRLGFAMGNVQQLPGGGVFVGWGTDPAFTEFSPGGQVRFDASFADGSCSYRAFRFPWVGRPATPPALVVAAAPDGSKTAYVSWNGATEVAHWRLRAGPRAGALRQVAEVPRTGFETAIPVRLAGGLAQATALDARGRELGTSRLRRI